MEAINVADAKSRLSELLSRAVAGERFVIRRREREVAVLLGTDDLERLERTSRVARRLAAVLGQDEALLEQIERGDVHPAMLVFGLWHEDDEMAGLDEHLAAERAQESSRATPEL